jgi:type I restriction enzyme S subunit
MPKCQSRIEKLIAELCPEGVEVKKLGEVAKIQRGASPRPIAKFITDDENGVPWIKIGDTSPAYKYVEKTEQKITPEGAKKSRVLKKGDFIMSNSMSFGRPYILNIDGAIHDGWASISDFENKLNSDFLYHYLSSNSVQNYWISKINSGSVSNLNADIIKTLPIPIPPLAIQQEIVKILDTFTTLEAELEAELEARKKQYEYYRDELLTFGEDMEWKTLGEVGKLLRGTAITAKETTDGEIPVVANAPKPIYFHSESNRSGETIVVARSGAYAGLVSFWSQPIFLTDAFSVSPDAAILKAKFVFYLLKQKQETIHSMKKGSGVPHVRVKDFESYSIPIPSLAEQDGIVAILDKFDALVNDISIGLPAELNARRKQYEYYRNKLLTFKEFPSSGKEFNSSPHEGNHPALTGTPPREGN